MYELRGYEVFYDGTNCGLFMEGEYTPYKGHETVPVPLMAFLVYQHSLTDTN